MTRAPPPLAYRRIMTIHGTASTPRVAPLRARWLRPTASFLLAALGAVAVGGLTSLGQQYLPEWLSSFANSAGGWAMLAFALVWLSRARPVAGAVLGAVAFLLMVEGYGVVSAWRGHFYADPLSSIWTGVALVAGPVLGLSAAVARHGSRLWSALAVVPLSAVLLGEGVWALVRISDTTSPVYWTVEIVLSVLFVGVAIGRRHLSLRPSAIVVVAYLAGAAVYAALWMLLDSWM